MLVVGPAVGCSRSRSLSVVLTTSTLLLAESKASKSCSIGRYRHEARRTARADPRLVPSVSFAPSMITRPGDAVGLETLCEARTRVGQSAGRLGYTRAPAAGDET